MGSGFRSEGPAPSPGPGWKGAAPPTFMGRHGRGMVLMELDRTDIEILRALQEDGRLSYRDLAQRVGVSVPTISARVATLEQLGVLSGYHASVDPERLGQTSLILDVKCQPAKADAVGDAIAAMPEVRWAVRTRGSRVLAEAVLPDGGLVDPFLERVEGVDGILEYGHHIATKRVKDEPRAVISEGLSTSLICFQCRKVIDGEPIKLKMDGRDHYVCCRSCEKLYAERYEKIKAGAARPEVGGAH